jgi:hypothetical protein
MEFDGMGWDGMGWGKIGYAGVGVQFSVLSLFLENISRRVK